MPDFDALAVELMNLSEAELIERARANPAWLAEIGDLTARAVDEARQHYQLTYYQVANPAALTVHTSQAREIAVVGGNRSSKTDTALAELAIQATGHVPTSLMAVYPREKIRAPIRARVVVNSLTDTLEPIIKPKLRWDQWNGAGDPGSGRGHWGWIPRSCLKGGTWETAYSEKTRTLHVAVDNFWHDANGQRWAHHGTSSVQFMSYDQDLSSFAGASLHLVVHDELPPAEVYRENRVRIADVRGQIITAFTPPDEIGASQGDVAWFYDQVYEKGIPGPLKDPLVDTVTLWTEHNRILSMRDVNELMASLTEDQRDVRLRGKFLHLAGLVYPLFSAHESTWCFRCQKRIIPVDGACLSCQGTDVDTFTHVIDRHPVPPSWPVLFVVDPHPRKRDAVGWFAVTPSDDLLLIGELEPEGTAPDVAKAVQAWEERYAVRPVRRLMDPNIATETNDKLGRGWTMRKGYDDVGLRCDLANDDLNLGIQTVTGFLRPDPYTRRPRFRCFRDCTRFIYSMGHFTWDEWVRHGADKEPKEKVRDRNKDFPDVLRYAAMDHPTYHGLTHGGMVRSRAGARSARGY